MLYLVSCDCCLVGPEPGGGEEGLLRTDQQAGQDSHTAPKSCSSIMLRCQTQVPQGSLDKRSDSRADLTVSYASVLHCICICIWICTHACHAYHQIKLDVPAIPDTSNGAIPKVEVFL